jgi:DNA mismatch repair protein MutS2
VSAFDDGISEKVLCALDWPQLQQALADRCSCAAAAEMVPLLPIYRFEEEVRTRLEEVLAFQEIVDKGGRPTFAGVRDVSEAVGFAVKGGVLEIEQLLNIADLAHRTRKLVRYFQNLSLGLTSLDVLIEELTPLDALEHELSISLDESGELTDRASPALGKLRRNAKKHQREVRSRAEGYLKDVRFEPLLQEQFVTLRSDRFVLPIRVEEKGRVPGLVHGRSGSGQTLFIEPDELVSFNNKVALSLLEVEQECFQIRTRLSGLVAQAAKAIAENFPRLTYLDITFAASVLGADMGGKSVKLCEHPHIQLLDAKHPLLALREASGEKGFEAIGNRISVEPGEESMSPGTPRVLLISGPNAGGKTVTLKTIGLCALMIRAGLLIPVKEGSTIGLFGRIFCDIGDDQSLADDLSSFSAHLQTLVSYLGEVGPHCLILLDEVFGRTDPEQGAALGIGLLEHLYHLEGTVVATTHFERLKHFAMGSPFCSSASVGFDLTTLLPTFKLHLGTPGPSYAIEISRRMGLPESLLERAVEVVETSETHQIEVLLSRLDKLRTELDYERGALFLLKNEAEKEKRSYQEALSKIREEGLSRADETVRALLEELEQARLLIKRKKRSLLGHTDEVMDEAELRDSQAEINRLDQKLRSGRQKRRRDLVKREREPLKETEIQVGTTVWVGPLNQAGEVIRVVRSSRTAQVQFGILKGSFSWDDLYRLKSHEGKRGRKKPSSVKNTSKEKGKHEARSPDPRHQGNTLDLRGYRVEEAINEIDGFFDRVYGGGGNRAFLIHGHGTGALREAIRGQLQDSAYVADFRGGEADEGGDGVTVVTLG